MLLLSTVLSLVLWSNTLVSAETHECTSKCYCKVVHSHKGNERIKSGCYKGNATEVICGYYKFVKNVSGGYCSSCQSTYSISQYACAGCGNTIEVEHSCGYYDNDWDVHSYYVYALSCGYEEGVSYEVTKHTCIGSSDKPGGCYSTSGTSTTCTSSDYTATGNSWEDTDTCSSCGSTITSWSEEYKCNTCGSLFTMGGSDGYWNSSGAQCGCTGSKPPSYGPPAYYHTNTVYPKICGRTTGFYDCHNTNVTSNKLCNKVVTKLQPTK